MKNSKHADVEVAIGLGTGAATLTSMKIIAESGLVNRTIKNVARVAGLSDIIDIGGGIAGVFMQLGTVGLIVAGTIACVTIIDGIYRMT